MNNNHKVIHSLLVALSILSVFLSPGLFAMAKSPSEKVNVIFIMSDDHAAHAIGAYRSRLASVMPTPTIDKLANEGTVFRNAFATNSICTPSRASILTGQYSNTNGVRDLFGAIPAKQQYLALEMSKSGYETAMIGKWHLKEEPGAFDFYKVLEEQGAYFDPVFRVQGDKPWPKNEVSYQGHSSDVITDQTIAWLKQRKGDKPFFLMHHYKAPHDMFEYAPRYEEYLANVHIPEPSDLYSQLDTQGSIATKGRNNSMVNELATSVSQRNHRRSMGIDMGIDSNLSHREFTHQAYQKYLKAYLRCVKGVDDNIARLIATLKELDLYDNTVIIYTGDQGMMLGEHDMIDKRWMYEESMRMPFIVRDPRIKQVKETDILINNTDYAPFILDLVGAAAPAQMQGRSFASALQGKEPKDWRKATYYRYWMHRAHHDVPAHFGVRSKEHKLMFFYGKNYEKPRPYYQRSDTNRVNTGAVWEFYEIKEGVDPPNASTTPAAWEFYDLTKDPDELNNVYGDPAYASVIAELKAEMKRQRQQYNETDEDFPEIKAVIDKHWDI